MCLFTHLAIDVNMEFNGQSVAGIKLYKFGVLPVKKPLFHKAVLRKMNKKSPAPVNGDQTCYWRYLEIYDWKRY